MSLRPSIYPLATTPIIAAKLFVFTSSKLCCGSYADPLQFIPPTFPGLRQRTLDTREREQTVVAQILDALTAIVAIVLSNSLGVICRKFLWNQRRWRQRKRLRRRRHFPRHIGLRYRALLHRKYRDARIAIQHVTENRSCCPELPPALSCRRAALWPAAGVMRCRNPKDRDERAESPRRVRLSSRATQPLNRPICHRPRAFRRNNRGWRCRWGRNIKSRSGSTAITDHAFPAPVRQLFDS